MMYIDVILLFDKDMRQFRKIHGISWGFGLWTELIEFWWFILRYLTACCTLPKVYYFLLIIISLDILKLLSQFSLCWNSSKYLSIFLRRRCKSDIWIFKTLQKPVSSLHKIWLFSRSLNILADMWQSNWINFFAPKFIIFELLTPFNQW